MAATLVDYLAESSYNLARDLSADSPKIGQSFTAVAGTLDSVKFYLAKDHLPTQNITAAIYEHSGTFGSSSTPTGAALAVSSPVASSALSTTMALVTFAFDNTLTLVAGAKYVVCVEYSGGVWDHVNVGTGSSAAHPGNLAYYASSSSSWVTPGGDAIFYIYETTTAAPTVTTTTPTLGTVHGTISAGGNVTADGGSAITERGVCYGLNPNPTIADSKVVVSGTTGPFSCDITGLPELTAYHLRAYATNAIGTSYGDDVTFTTPARIHVYEGGTDGARDGDDITVDGSSGNPVEVVEIGTALKRHVRFPQGYGCASDKVATVIPPNTAFSVSADGITFGASADLGRVLDVNVPVWLRQDVRLPEGWAAHRLLNIGYGADPVDIAAPVMTVAPAATAGAEKVTYSGHAATDNVAVVSFDFYGNTTGTAPTSGTTPTLTGLSTAAFDWTGRAPGVPAFGWMRPHDPSENIGAWLASSPASVTPTSGHLFFDDFNRADGALGAAWLSSPATIVSNTLKVSATNNNAHPASTTNVGNATLKVTMASVGYIVLVGRALAADSGTTNKYRLSITPTAWTLLYGTTSLATGSLSHVIGDVFELTCTGTTIIAKHNGSTLTTQTHATRSTGAWGLVWGNGVATQIDDFTIDAA